MNTTRLIKRKQVSFYISIEDLKKLDRWLRWQKESRQYEIDRSHVISVMLRRFLDRNPLPDSGRTGEEENTG